MADEEDEAATDDKPDERKLEEEYFKTQMLQSEQARKQEKLGRLQQNLTDLKEELANRNDIIRKMKTEPGSRNRPKDTASSKSEGVVTDTIKQQVRDRLRENIPIIGDKDDELVDGEDSDEDAHEAAAFDQDAGGETQAVHHTVLVHYATPEQSTEDQNFALTFRIDQDTTLQSFHRDCCSYWGCSPSEHLLCRFSKKEDDSLKVLWCDDERYPNPEANEYEQMQFKDNPKQRLQDQDVLDNSEDSHVYLVPRASFVIFKEAEKKRAATMDDAKAQSKPDQPAGQEERGTMLKQLKLAIGMGVQERQEPQWLGAFQYQFKGVHRMLKYRHRNDGNRGHPWVKHDLSEFVAFATFIVLSFVAIQLRFNFDAYSLTSGVRGPLMSGVDGESYTVNTVNFKHIERHQDLWDWLGGSLSYQLFDEGSMLRKTFVPVGYMRLRQQRSKAKQCDRNNIPLYLERDCFYPTTDGGHEDTADIAVEGDWLNFPAIGRYGPKTYPLTWNEGVPSITPLLGEAQWVYGPSGYSVDYDMNLVNNTISPPAVAATFAEDLPVLRADWINVQTRMLSIEVVLANYHLAGFVSAVFFLEFTPSGGVHHSQVIRPFRISNSDSDDIAWILDWFRWIFVILYLLVYKVNDEIRRKVKKGRSGPSYIFSLKGFLDQSIVALFVGIQYMRWLSFPPDPRDLTAFKSYSHHAMVSEHLEIAEAILLYFALARFALLMRFITQVFRFFQTFTRSFHIYMYYLLIFLPVCFGTMFLFNTIWAPYLKDYSTWSHSMASLGLSMVNSVPAGRLLEARPEWGVVLLGYFFLGLFCLMTPMFLALAVHSYFEVDLLEGLSKQDQTGWSRDEWMRWILFTPLYNMMGGSADDGDEDGDGDEDDDDGDDDDDDEAEGKT